MEIETDMRRRVTDGNEADMLCFESDTEMTRKLLEKKVFAKFATEFVAFGI